MKPKILVSRKISDLAEEKLSKEFDVTLNPKDEPIPESELIKIINDYDGMISTGFDKIGENFFNNLNGKLKIIAQVGVGYDNISVNSALEKKVKVYTDKEKVPYFTNEAMQMIDRLGVSHLLVDLPSIDRGNDDGRLSNHRIYWRQPADFHSIMKETMTNRTITEMIYVDDFIDDGLYLLNIQFPAIETDAVPSRPIIYPTEQL